MASKFDKLVESFKAEEQAAATPPEETTPPTPEETTPPAPEETTPPAPEEQPNPSPEEKPEDTPPAKPQEPPASPAEHAYRRQLAKMKAKHEAELQQRDEQIKKLLGDVDDLKKRIPAPQKPALKTRDQFESDDDFITYLAQQKVDEILAGRDAEAAKKAEEAEQARKQQEAEQAEVNERREQWLSNVDQAFKGDEGRKKAFLDRVEYCNTKGLGTILDKCPVAADFLMQRPTGPIVFEKLLNDRDTFSRVFNESMLSPLDIYYELRAVEQELLAEKKAAPAAPAAPVVPHIGRPGRQAASNQTPDIFSDPKAMRAFIRS